MRVLACAAAAAIPLASCLAPIVPDAPLPAALDAVLRIGEEAEARGDRDRAGEAYASAARAFPDHAAAWTHHGEFLRFWRHDAGAARAAFERALAAPQADRASLAFAWRGLGELARHDGRIDEAIRFFERSLAIRPLADTHRSLSALHANDRRDFARAAHHARAAVDASPDDPIALLQFAVEMERLGRREEGQRAFERAIALAGCDDRGASDGPVHCCVLYNGACYHSVRGDRERALAMLAAFFATPNHRHVTPEEVLADPDFASIRDDPAFRALLERGR
jgi:tetratricopeptide (TPR) repeat protein